LNAQGTIFWCQLNLEIKQILTKLVFCFFSLIYLIPSKVYFKHQKFNLKKNYNFSIEDFVQGCPLQILIFLELEVLGDEPQIHWILGGNHIRNSFNRIVKYILRSHKSTIAKHVVNL